MNRRIAVLASVVVLALVSVACSTSPPSGGVTPVPCPEELVLQEGWTAAGDSVFAGVGSHKGAPAQIQGMTDWSYPGDTLVKLKILTSQATVKDRLAGALCREGVVPRNMIIHAGAADMIARETWGERFAFERYAQEVQLMNDWLTSLGVERIVWTTLIPMTSWAHHASENPFRMQFNEWLRASGLEVLDCEASLTDEFGWLPTELALDRRVSPIVRDGAHLNRDGARTHAQCLIDGIGDPSLTMKE